MAIQKKSLISNKAVTTKSTSKVNPATPKLQTSLKMAKAATHAVTAIKLGKQFKLGKIF